MKRIASCKQCRKKFTIIPGISGKGWFCSRKCHAIHRRKPNFNKTAICLQCNKKFTYYHYPSQNPRILCSKECNLLHNSIKNKTRSICQRLVKIGDEKEFTKDGYKGTDIYVCTGFKSTTTQNRIPIWERKCKLNIERILGRKINRAESGEIVFLDGNRLNCDPVNLYLNTNRDFRFCTKCGKPRIYKGKEESKKKYICRQCKPSPFSTLSFALVWHIKWMLSRGYSPPRLARLFRVSDSNIYSIQHEKIWKEVQL